MPLLVDLIGWAGAGALLAAYWRVSTRRTDGAAVSYQTLNLIGSVLVLLNSLYHGAYPSVAINGGLDCHRGLRHRHDAPGT